MAGEYCTCPDQPCPICRDQTNVCSCGCGYEVGSLEFIRFHVETEEEQIQREALEQYDAEQQAMKEYYGNLPEPHPIICGCVECN